MEIPGELYVSDTADHKHFILLDSSVTWQEVASCRWPIATYPCYIPTFPPAVTNEIQKLRLVLRNVRS